MKIIFFRIAIRNLSKAGGLSEALFQEVILGKGVANITYFIVSSK